MATKKKQSKKIAKVNLNQHILAALVVWVLFAVNIFRYVIINELYVGDSIVGVVWVQMLSEVFIAALIVLSFVVGWRAVTARMGNLTRLVGAVTLVICAYFVWDLFQWTDTVAQYWAAH